MYSFWATLVEGEGVHVSYELICWEDYGRPWTPSSAVLVCELHHNQQEDPTQEGASLILTEGVVVVVFRVAGSRKRRKAVIAAASYCPSGPFWLGNTWMKTSRTVGRGR